MITGGLGTSAPVLTTISARLPTLRAGPRAVCAVVQRDPEFVVETTAAGLARAAGVSAATVVRTAQALGFSGFPQLRVMLARDLGAASSRPTGRGPVGVVWDFFQAVADALPDMTSLLDAEALDEAIKRIAAANDVLVTGSGVSAPVATDLAMRLTSIGCSATASADALDQRIRARLLGPRDVCVVVSSTGATSTSLAVARCANAAGAAVIAITAFDDTPLSKLADIELIVVMGAPKMTEELHFFVRIPQMILVNGIAAAVASLRPNPARAARARAIEAVSELLLEP